MSNPQQPELRRSETTPGLSPDSIAGELKAKGGPGGGAGKSGNTGPVPKGNVAKVGAPGRGKGTVSDKPDLDKFAEKLGIDEPDPDGERAHQAAVESVQQEHEEAEAKAEERAAEERRAKAKRSEEAKAKRSEEAKAKRSEEAKAKRSEEAKAKRSEEAKAKQSGEGERFDRVREVVHSAEAGSDDDARGLVGQGLQLAIGAVGIGAGAVAVVVPKAVHVVQRLIRPLTHNPVTKLLKR